MKNCITVFTPTFNRSHLITNLYESLKSQIDQNFIWLIIDDGSTDNTKEVIDEFILEDLITIQYFYQENSGKYIAHNNGVMLTKTELFVCVDSDDRLLPNAIERTRKVWAEVKKDSNVCGIISPKLMGTKETFIGNKNYGTLMDLYNKFSFKGETMLVFRTDILRRFLFPSIVNEKFMQENVIYNRIDNYYIYKYDNHHLYESEYQDDGLTKNMLEITLNNPLSTLYSYKNTAVYQKSLKKKIKAFGSFLAVKEVFGIQEIYPELKVSPFTCILGFVLKKHYYKLFIEHKNKKI